MKQSNKKHTKNGQTEVVTIFQCYFASPVMCSTCTRTHPERTHRHVQLTQFIWVWKLAFAHFEILSCWWRRSTTHTQHTQPALCVAILMGKPANAHTESSHIEWMAEVACRVRGKMCKTHGLDEKSNRKAKKKDEQKREKEK